MFKNHPKGLPVLFFTEMWERFGFYTMLAIFVLYLQENFKWDAATTTNIYGIFLAAVYFTPIFGGWIADNLWGYGKTITIGAVVMGIGYALMAVPTHSATQLYIALLIVALGNGLFKANISVLVGNLYSHADGSTKDAGYNIFYMGINIGAFYAPQAAAGIKNLMINHFHLSLAEGYNAGFGLAALGMVVSLLIFNLFKKYYKDADYQSKHVTNTEKDLQLPKEQEKERVIALITIFAIVIFFWMSFHQNGAAMTLFAKTYTNLKVGKITYLLFDIVGLHGILALLLGAGFFFSKDASPKAKTYSLIAMVIGAVIIGLKLSSAGNENQISPEQFQSFNPMFIVLLTPVVVGYFKYLHNKGKEPSSPGKIGIGMVLTAVTYFVMILASLGLPAVHTLNGSTSPVLVSPYWLITSYFIITLAELHLSPMGLSFVSKVAPPKMKGLMMGMWFGATAVGNYLAGFIGRFYQDWELWQFFLLLVITSLFAAFLIALFLKKLKHATR
jgi:POT family proton-dependent oligopeptide transporter